MLLSVSLIFLIIFTYYASYSIFYLFLEIESLPAWSYRTTVVVAFAYAFAFAVVVVVEFAWPNRLDAVVEIADDDGYDYHSSVGFQHRIGSIDCSIVC